MWHVRCSSEPHAKDLCCEKRGAKGYALRDCPEDGVAREISRVVWSMLTLICLLDSKMQTYRREQIGRFVKGGAQGREIGQGGGQEYILSERQEARECGQT